MLNKYIAHIRLRAVQDNATNVWQWAIQRTLARLGNDLFIFGWHVFFAWLPSLPGRQIRRVVLKLCLGACGSGVSVGDNVHIEYPARIRLGNNVWIGRNCHISGAGGIQIGNDVLLAHSTMIETAGHAIVEGQLYRETAIVYSPVQIGNNTWCGTRTTILYGTTIGQNVVVAAGAVVTSNVPDNCIVGGVPAKLIRTLDWPDTPSNLPH
jgi:maltose O-acetyltransferase